MAPFASSRLATAKCRPTRGACLSFVASNDASPTTFNFCRVATFDRDAAALAPIFGGSLVLRQ